MWEEDGTGWYPQWGSCTPAIAQLQPGVEVGLGQQMAQWQQQDSNDKLQCGSQRDVRAHSYTSLSRVCLVATEPGRAKVASSKEC